MKLIMARFIEKVQEYPELYVHSKNTKKNVQLWGQIAQQCSLESGMFF